MSGCRVIDNRMTRSTSRTPSKRRESQSRSSQTRSQDTGRDNGPNLSGVGFPGQGVLTSTCVVINPFHGGSHRHFVDMLVNDAFPEADIAVFTLPGKKWHWRLLVSAAHFASVIPRDMTSKAGLQCTLFVTSLMNLADLVAIRPDLAHRRKVIYFHENQFAYPSSPQARNGVTTANLSSFRDADESYKQQKTKKEWSEYGWAQIMSCLAADTVLFNSKYNRDTFLEGVSRLLSMVPSPSRPKGISQLIAAKSSVLYYPLRHCKNIVPDFVSGNDDGSITMQYYDDKLAHSRPLHVVWPHRWEHDKGPDMLLSLIKSLNDNAKEKGYSVWFSILGQNYSESPMEFTTIKNEFWKGGIANERHKNLYLEPGLHLLHLGYAKSRAAYEEVLIAADVVLSTARHDFFGSSTMEAVSLGCFPLCPNKLVYPELYPNVCLYRTEAQLHKKLRNFAKRPDILRTRTAPDALTSVSPSNYTLSTLKEAYARALGVETPSQQGANPRMPLSMTSIAIIFIVVVSFTLHFILLTFNSIYYKLHNK